MSITHMVGIDEAGRGPLAGPVAVGGVLIPTTHSTDAIFGEVKDSKVLTPASRERLCAALRSHSMLATCVRTTPASYIDAQGIVAATNKALRRVLHTLVTHPEHTLVLMDGSLYAPATYLHQKTIVHGDVTEPLISAASIIAKVHRDRIMGRVATRYPNYGFEKHKGYGTQAHVRAIQTYGLTSIHRTSFCKKVT
jgi:ribonuclease HII